MDIKRAKKEIKDSIEAYLAKDEYGDYMIPSIRQRPILLMGPPGIGKTQVMEQVAKECKVALVSYTITHHTRQSAVGLPFIEKKTYDGKEYSVTEYTMSEIIASVYDKMEETGLREGILFIDEINCVSETLAPTMLQFLQCKTFGNQKIPTGWIIVAAGNPPEYNKSVRDFDVVTLDRIKKIDVDVNYDVWKEYAYQADIHPAILAYLEIRRDYFYRMETTVDGKVFATARGWEDLSQLLKTYEKLGKKADREVVHQYIQHWKIAKDFANYLELYQKYQRDYQVDEILNGVIREEACHKLEKAPFDERLSVISLLTAKLNDGFLALSMMEDRLERLQKLFGGVKPGNYDEQEYPSALDRLEGILAGVQAEWKYKKEAGLLDRKEAHLTFDTVETLEGLVKELRADHITEADAVWERVSQAFAAKNDQYEAQFDLCGEQLEHAFDFMEAAFGQSQEMVVFITSLNMGFYSVRFLGEYECERYYRYNQTLLFDGQEKEILEKIEKQ